MLFKPKSKSQADDKPQSVPAHGFRVGLSFTPLSLSCVVLSQDHQFLGTSTQKLKKGLIDTQKGPLDASALQKAVIKALKEAGVREESFPACQIHLSIPAPLFSNIAIEKRTEPEDIERLLAEQIREMNPMGEKTPLISWEWLGESENFNVYITSSVDKMTLRAYLKLFNGQPWHVASAETTPTSILRSLAGSGVLDVMLQQLGNSVPWALIGFCGDRAWLMQWQGKQPLFAQTLLIEGTREELEKTLQERVAYSGFNPPATWLTWQAPFDSPAFQVQDMALRAPKSVCQAGPFFRSSDAENPTAVDALGAALHDSVHFPFNWNLFQLAPDMSVIWSSEMANF